MDGTLIAIGAGGALPESAVGRAAGSSPIWISSPARRRGREGEEPDEQSKRIIRKEMDFFFHLSVLFPEKDSGPGRGRTVNPLYLVLVPILTLDSAGGTRMLPREHPRSRHAAVSAGRPGPRARGLGFDGLGLPASTG